ncbi:MAG: hypothetical protein J7L96_10480 [Bacteroidales bacterium]|nr:hypothetical protein [Bacteroidales bacterium]
MKLNTKNTLFIMLLLFCVILIFVIPNQIVAQDRGQSSFGSWNLHQKMESESDFSGLFWQQLGPAFMGNRVESIDCPIGQDGVIYVGFGSGSLWKSTNNGMNWENIFKNQTYSIGDVAVSLSEPAVIWVGTGENLRASRGFCYPGTGVYKSKNAGKTWVNMGLLDSHHISRVIIDPTNSKRVFVASLGHFWSHNEQRGLFMTEDEGSTWKHILKISDSVGVSDVAWDPRNKIIYAASWQPLAGEASGIYKSVDMGQSWKRINNGFPADKGIGRIGISISPSHPARLFAVIDNRNILKFMPQKPLRGAEVYRSDDYGESWQKTNNDIIEEYSGFGWAFGDIVISPTNYDEVYLLGIHLLHSTNGGKNFSRIAGDITHLAPSSASSLHLDQHDLYIDPLNADHMVLGNDGGVYISYDHGGSWLHTNTIPGGEFYSLNYVDDDPIRLYGGTQDNSSITGVIPKDDLWNSGYDWSYVWLDPWSGGDGFVTIEDPSDPNYVYWESQNGYLNIKNMRSGQSKIIKPVPDSDEKPLRNSWKTPFFLSKHDHKTIYYGANKVYKSVNRGEKWYRISHDLTYSKSNYRNSRAITTLAESPVSSGYLYAGTDKGIVWISRNDGAQWTEVSDGIPMKKIVSIYPSNYSTSRVFLVARGMNDDDQNAYVFVSNTLGENWKNISNNLPPVPVNCIMEDPKIENLLYLGTDYGVFVSLNRGKKWNAISNLLPAASIQEIKLISDQSFLLIATHGMGLYKSWIEPLRHFAQSGNPTEYSLLGTLDGKLPKQKDYNNDWDIASIYPAAWSWYNPKPCLTQIQVLDNNEKEIWSTQVKGVRGLNQYNWNLQISKRNDKSLYPVSEIKFPKPGTYNVVLTCDSVQIKEETRILQN